jgi:hypothetical protein
VDMIFVRVFGGAMGLRHLPGWEVNSTRTLTGDGDVTATKRVRLG